VDLIVVEEEVVLRRKRERHQATELPTDYRRVDVVEQHVPKHLEEYGGVRRIAFELVLFYFCFRFLSFDVLDIIIININVNIILYYYYIIILFYIIIILLLLFVLLFLLLLLLLLLLFSAPASHSSEFTTARSSVRSWSALPERTRTATARPSSSDWRRNSHDRVT
jgi:hypothetical protein